MMKKLSLLSLIMIMILSGCMTAQVTQAVETSEPVHSLEPTLEIVTVEPDEPTALESPTEAIPTEESWETVVDGDGEAILTIVEKPLTAGKYAEDVLDEYADEPWFSFKGIANEFTVGEDVYSFFTEEVPGEEGVGNQTANVPDVVVTKNDERVGSTSLGAASNMNPIWALVADTEGWYLEVFRGEGALDENGQAWPVGGDILMNGESLNALNGYDESFGLHLILGKPIYFFVRDGVYGYVYEGQETVLDYSDISHYGCCSAGIANPRGSEDRVVIFADRGDQTYLVMIGDF